MTTVSLADVMRKGSTRGLDFAILEELRKRTGVSPDQVLRFSLSELICNALDKDNATKICINIKKDGEWQCLSVSDNGTKKLTIQELGLILDFENKASSKRGILRVSRGYLGNALKCIIGYSFTLSENKGLSPLPVTVKSAGHQYEITLKPDRIREAIDHEIETTEIQDDGLTTVTVIFPRDETDNSVQLKDIIFSFHMVNPDRLFTFNIFGERGILESAGNGKPIRNETSVLWYNESQFTDLFKDFVRTTPDATLKDFMALFRGFTSKDVVREKLIELNAANHDSKTTNYEFLPSTTIQEVSLPQISDLFHIMKQGSKIIATQSIPSVLGKVGREAFENVCKANGWKRLRYHMVSGTEITCDSDYKLSVETPYLIELAVFDRKEDDAEGLKVYQCVNFMSSTEDLFARIYDISSHLAQVGIRHYTPITVVTHFVCPSLNWLNYGKSGLDTSTVVQEDMKKTFKKILPIPQAPKIYRYSTPYKPLSWIPHGKVGDGSYEIRLKDFAGEILALDSQRTKKVKYSSRGWCYTLEGLGKITKGEFNACQTAINNCRKTGLLPIDFVSEDQDVTRHLEGIIDALDPVNLLLDAKDDVERGLRRLASLTTDYWVGEEYYVMMVVEKGDLRNLFEPICDEYLVPIASSKGWSPINLRYNIASLAERAEAKGLTPVLLLFYDLDPKGEEISDRFRKNLEDCEGGTGWDPHNLIIERFGLNEDDVNRYNLMWIDNLQTGSGREPKETPRLKEYVRKHGRKKCEANALFKNDETLNVAEQICRKAIEKYYGEDAKERFQEKTEQSKVKQKEIYDNSIWQDFSDKIDGIADALSEKRLKEEKIIPKAEAETEVLLDGIYCGRCPKCDEQFSYNPTDYRTDHRIYKSDFGRLVRCENCHQLMRLRRKEAKS
ncbi:MAG: hypothetical protein V1915_03315 [Candidatus Bathyarchaeota archaeon]